VSSRVRGYASRDSSPNALPMSEGARHGEPVGLHDLEKSHALREEGTTVTLPVDVSGGGATACALAYWLDWPPGASTWCAASPAPFQRAARVRAVSENTTLGWVLVQALREYAARTWTPRWEDTSPESAHGGRD